MTEKRMAPVHPGEILQKLFLAPLEMSQNALARFFRMTPRYWMGLQADYDLDMAQDDLAEKINAEIKPCEKCTA